MEDKYYTPEIEEFHVGFEYYIKHYHKLTGEVNKEYLNNKDNFNWVAQIWEPHMVMAEQFNIIEYRSSRAIIISVPESIKVKYLDKEDIESLGFILKSDKTNHHTYHSGGYAITHCILNSNVDIYYMDGSEFVNGITIKNKSELKKLLKQLNIIE